MREMSADGIRRERGITLTVLVCTLLGYPAFRAAGLLPVGLTRSAADWWLFWLGISAGHWTLFGLVVLALRWEGAPWASIGLDWSVLRKWKWWLLGALALLVLAALAAPGIHYGEEIPVREGLFPLQPITAAERLFWILGGVVTAGVAEETIFRGFAITRLGAVLRSPWLALPVSAAAFVFLHGVPPNLPAAASYASAGLIFGAAFILMRCRRLEILMIVHGAINGAYIFLA